MDTLTYSQKVKKFPTLRKLEGNTKSWVLRYISLYSGMLCRINRYTTVHAPKKICCIHLYKGKAVPLQTWSGPEDSRKLRFPDFMTTAQNGGKVVSLTHRPPLSPGNTHFC